MTKKYKEEVEKKKTKTILLQKEQKQDIKKWETRDTRAIRKTSRRKRRRRKRR
jgi:hypothetical protein